MVVELLRVGLLVELPVANNVILLLLDQGRSRNAVGLLAVQGAANGQQIPQVIVAPGLERDNMVNLVGRSFVATVGADNLASLGQLAVLSKGFANQLGGSGVDNRGAQNFQILSKFFVPC